MKEIKLSRRTFTGLATMTAATIAAVGIVGPGTAFGQSSLPRGPITLVVPFAAGGATDVVSRLVAAKASERIGRPIILTTRAGRAASWARHAWLAVRRMARFCSWGLWRPTPSIR